MKWLDKNKYKITTIIVSLIICLVVIYLNLLSHEKTQKIYLEQTEKTIIDLKQSYLKDTINNVFIEIDSLRETKYSNYKKNTESRLMRFKEKIDLTEQGFTDYFIDNFTNDSNPEMWTSFLWDTKTGEILYASLGLQIGTIDSTVNHVKSLVADTVIIEKGSIKGIFGVSKLYIEKLVKNEIADIIRNRKFSNDSYIWVNEVINYNGGENYAIRRVHPNLRETEGTYLSTNIEDIKGNLPYLSELEGINENGELFSTYYFKKLGSSVVSEKISYAKLYKDYDWIIAMGDHLDDISAYTEKTNAEIKSLSSESVIQILKYIFLILLIGFIILYIVANKYLSTSTKSLEKEMNLDVLTMASSRRSGKNSLKIAFNKHREKGENFTIMMFDIDDFKSINDKYGHEIGDITLIETAKTIDSIIRSSDQLIRWGGDEFIVILPGLKKENISEFGNKVLDGISSMLIPTENEIISITISIGFSYFKDIDNDYNEVLKRADKAMYKSKEQGKNRANIE